MDTVLLDLEPAPSLLDAAVLGGAGGLIGLMNVGDDVLHWRVAAENAAPTGRPGFPLRRGQRAEISLPASGLGLWAWAARGSRIAATPFIGKTALETLATGEIAVGATPVQVPAPVGASVGTAFVAVNVGAEDVSFLQAQASPTPAPSGGLPVGPGEEFRLAVAASTETRTAWAWCAKGSVLLLQAVDDRWRLTL